MDQPADPKFGFRILRLNLAHSDGARGRIQDINHALSILQHVGDRKWAGSGLAAIGVRAAKMRQLEISSRPARAQLSDSDASRGRGFGWQFVVGHANCLQMPHSQTTNVCSEQQGRAPAKAYESPEAATLEALRDDTSSLIGPR